MSLWTIAWCYVWDRKVTTFLTIFSVALGVALIAAVHTLREETRKRFEEEGQAFDMVVGAKGSPLQLVLSSVYFMDSPTGNIPESEYQKLLKLEDVKAAFPIGLGDTYRGFRIVGTNRDLMEHEWVLGDESSMRVKKPFVLREGRYFQQNYEAVVGAIVAKDTGLKMGDTFVGTHGFYGEAHDHAPYTVVGILEKGATPNDRAIFTTIESVWDVHGQGGEHVHGAAGHTQSTDAHAGEIHACDDHACDDHAGEAHAGEEELEVTAILVTLKSPALRFTFFDTVNKELNAMGAIPVIEIQKLYENVLSTVNGVLLAVAYLVVVSSGLTIMIGLYLSIQQRRRDLAIMRALGASTWDIFGAVILEAFWVTILGVLTGWFLGNAVSWALGLYLSRQFGMTITAFGLNSDVLWSFAAVIAIGYMAGILPAWQAYRTDVARDLAEL